MLLQTILLILICISHFRLHYIYNLNYIMFTGYLFSMYILPTHAFSPCTYCILFMRTQCQCFIRNIYKSPATYTNRFILHVGAVIFPLGNTPLMILLMLPLRGRKTLVATKCINNIEEIATLV